MNGIDTSENYYSADSRSIVNGPRVTSECDDNKQSINLTLQISSPSTQGLKRLIRLATNVTLLRKMGSRFRSRIRC
ncbi:hypothetical protein TNCV_1570561 [Trichonephila clavipes]|uniref:Uncharacterized protein n=1 Tax=Trichonephila clavipes TaxID=2585209 RepID=A0A8X6VPY5_TRICX|nr:hypothetical protein TNCV_1570561 [Trichonephila clavipes]